MQVIKRDGSLQPFDFEKIKNAVNKAFLATEGAEAPDDFIDYLKAVSSTFDTDKSVEEIQDFVEYSLMEFKWFDVAKNYITYRYTRHLIRESNTTDKAIKELIEGTNEYWNTENSNKNAKVVTTQRDYLAGITSTDITRRLLLPKDIVEAHDAGIIHFHDADYFAQNALYNCCLINLEDCLQNGTIINGVTIDKPHTFRTACTIATQIITAVASSQYGGCTISLTHLAPFIRDSYNRYESRYIKRDLPYDKVQQYAKEDLQKEIEDGVQTFNYQVNSMSTTNGQAPFLSVNMYLGETSEFKEELAMLIEEFLNQRILGMKNESGVYVTPAFPKLLYVLEEDNIHPDSKYYYLTELAAECTAKRMVPDYISEKVMKALKNGDCYPCMGCRSFLTPSDDHKYYGRFNQGVVTVNLADIALTAIIECNKKHLDELNDTFDVIDLFWKIFDERMELVHRALQERNKRLEGKPSDMAPILWQNGAISRLPKHAEITPLLHNNYSTISIGYAALYECVKALTGESHSSGLGKELGLAIMQRLNDYAAKWRAEENISYSVYGTPIESTTYKFAKCLKKRFGIIEGITDKDYVTNSYHIPVTEEIDPFEKLSVESEFQALSPGGAISYIETANLQANTEAVMEVIKYIYDNIMYAELNTKSDYCQVCGFNGEMQIDENMEWYCPNCGNREQDKMNVARRTCGYIGSNYWNKGRTQEIKERYVHLDNHDAE